MQTVEEVLGKAREILAAPGLYRIDWGSDWEVSVKFYPHAGADVNATLHVDLVNFSGVETDPQGNDWRTAEVRVRMDWGGASLVKDPSVVEDSIRFYKQVLGLMNLIRSDCDQTCRVMVQSSEAKAEAAADAAKKSVSRTTRVPALRSRQK